MRQRLFLLLIAITIAPGCTSTGRKSGAALHPVTSKPPASAIVLSEAITVEALKGTVAFPPGEYHAAYEDQRVFYFEAPSKITVDQVVTYGYDGGLIVVHGATAPSGWYVFDHPGKPTTGRFKTIPKYELLQ